MDAAGYSSLKKRAEAISHKRIEVKKEVQMLKSERETIIEELKALGIEDVSNLPQQIESWKAELAQKETELVRQIKEIEQKLGV